MVDEIRIYVEGGGDGANGKALFREGFHQFLREMIAEVRRKRLGFHIVACGPRWKAISNFEKAVPTHENALCMLIIDSDQPLPSAPSPNAIMANIGHKLPAEESQVHFMVQLMESWFLADRERLAEFYGSGFNAGSIPGSPVEEIDPSSVLQALRHATRNTQKGEYAKLGHGSRLLQVIRPSVVKDASPYCERLFNNLATHIVSSS